MRLYFNCKLLSEIVLTSRSATEGFHPSLSYIPGSKFLGIAASELYDETDKQRMLDLFHNGAVRFGDAHIAINDCPSYPTPFAWYKDKLGHDQKIYLYHKLTQEIWDDLVDNEIQLNQQRKGYINREGTVIANIEQDFSIKSAYDTVKRKSEDEKMYGYHALKAGTEFLFSVELPENKVYQELIIASLTGKKRVGRSRTAEYGLLDIKQISPPEEEVQHQASDGDELIIYAYSNLCFFDENGFPTTDINASDLGVTKGRIDWQKSQIRYRKYQSYNSKRLHTNEDRIILEKGSVIVIKTDGRLSTEKIPYWVGSLNNEGFGKILCNPTFLMSDSASISGPQRYSYHPPRKKSFIQEGLLDNQILQLVDKRTKIAGKDARIEEVVEQFFKKNKTRFSRVTNSQWGAIRGIAKSTTNKAKLIHLLFHEDKSNQNKSEGFLRRGIAAKNWEKKAEVLKTFAEQDENSQILLIKFASKMQKYVNKKEGKNG